MGIANIIGYTSVLLHLWSFASNDRKTILIVGSISLSLYIVHIQIMGSTASTVAIACFGLLASLAGLILSENTRRKLIKATPAIAVVIFLLGGMDLMGFFAALGTLFSTWAKLTEDVLKIKTIYLGSATSWLATGMLLDSIPAVLFDVSGIVVLLWSIRDLKRKKVISSQETL